MTGQPAKFDFNTGEAKPVSEEVETANLLDDGGPKTFDFNTADMMETRPRKEGRTMADQFDFGGSEAPAKDSFDFDNKQPEGLLELPVPTAKSAGSQIKARVQDDSTGFDFEEKKADDPAIDIINNIKEE